MQQKHSNDNDIERLVLGALLIDNMAFDEVSHLISAALFTDSKHLTIFLTLNDMRAKNMQIDIATLRASLMQSSQLEAAGGIMYVIGLNSAVNTSAHIKTHVKILQDMAMRREIESFATRLLTEVKSDAIGSLRENINTRLDDIANRYSFTDVSKLADVNNRVLEDLNNIEAKQSRPFGLTAVDRRTGGLKDGELVIIGARPSMGKTSLALQIAKENGKAGFPTLVISLETNEMKLAKRLISMDARVAGDVIRDKKFTQDEFSRIYNEVSKMKDLPVYIYDKPMRLVDIKPFIKNLVKKFGIKTIVLDYIQLVSDDGSGITNREQFVSSVSRTLKLCAMEHGLAVVALSQLSRMCEERSDKRPLLSDIRESGAIEQDADMIIFLYRDEYYGIMQNSKGESTAGKAEFIIAKFRDGEIGFTEIGFDAQHTKFYQLDEYSPLPQVQESAMPDHSWYDKLDKDNEFMPF